MSLVREPAVLPKLKVGIQTTKPWYRAGEVVDASIDAAYFFGKPVGTGDVLIEASTLDIGQTVFQKIQAKTDAAGKTSFSIKLPQTLIGLPLDNGNALVNLRATVTDTAGQQVKQDRLLTVSQDGTNVALIPESTALVPGVENHLDLFATDPLGAPLAAASVDLALPGGATMAATTDEFGWAGFAWTPGADLPSTSVTATVKVDGQPPAAARSTSISRSARSTSSCGPTSPSTTRARPSPSASPRPSHRRRSTSTGSTAGRRSTCARSRPRTASRRSRWGSTRGSSARTGSRPTSSTRSAFGVMEFADMAEVSSVDPAMIARTKTWLAKQQQPDGSWTGDQTEFFSFQTSTVRNTAFVAWALASAGTTGGPIDAALSYVKTHLGASEDAYTLGIVANAFALGAPSDPYTATLLAQLDAKKTVNGDQVYWSTAGTQTDFYGSGKDADVTATALAAHALMSAGGYAGTAQGALSFLVASRDTQGNFGSTQATIWTLRALLLAAEKGTGDAAVGNVDVTVDGAPFTTVTLTKEQGDVLSTVDLSSLATTGTHDVTLTFAGTGKLSYGLVAKHNVPWATVAEPPGPIAIDVAYDKTTLTVNETASVTVTVTNTQAVTQNMVMLTLGVPPGFEVVAEDLDAYVKSGVLSAYEPKGKQLDLYVSKLAANAKLVLTYRVRATMPVKAEDGGAKAYPYYQPTAKSTAASTKLEVVN